MEGIGGGAPKRRVMVVADPGRESAAALQWALSHAILEHDELFLVHVEHAPAASRRAGSGANGGATLAALLRRPAPAAPAAPLGSAYSTFSSLNPTGNGSGSGEGGEGDFLEGMRAACEKAQPKVRVQIERVEMEGKDKAAAILSQSRILAADLLVVGQRRSSSILGCRLSGSLSSKGTDPAEFLIEHSKCLCVSVQKKGQNAGYLLNTKTHKNFWLLA